MKELVPNHFTTFTIRESGPVYYTAEDWKLIWGHFVRYLRLAGVDFQYVSVLERHPTNPDHLHMHVAWRGEASLTTTCSGASGIWPSVSVPVWW